MFKRFFFFSTEGDAKVLYRWPEQLFIIVQSSPNSQIRVMLKSEILYKTRIRIKVQFAYCEQIPNTNSAFQSNSAIVVFGTFLLVEQRLPHSLFRDQIFHVKSKTMTVVRYTAGLCQKNFFNLVADSEVNEITFSLYHFYLLCSMAQH